MLIDWLLKKIYLSNKDSCLSQDQTKLERLREDLRKLKIKQLELKMLKQVRRKLKRQRNL